MDAVGTVRDTCDDLMKEDDLVLPFLDLHGRIGEVRQLGGQLGQLMVMRGKQRAALVDTMQVLECRPGN